MMLRSKDPRTVKNRASTLNVAALKYEGEKHKAPCVVAAGSGYTAQRILQVAMENGIAIYHDESAATLLTKLDIGQEIPSELYQIVVDIYLSLLDAAEKQRNPVSAELSVGEEEAHTEEEIAREA